MTQSLDGLTKRQRMSEGRDAADTFGDEKNVFGPTALGDLLQPTIGVKQTWMGTDDILAHRL